jgi:hypothetical protein
MAPSICASRSRSAYHVRDGGHEAQRVGMRGLVDHLVHRADLGDAAGVHHRHAVAGLGDHAHVVSDQHDGCVMLAADALEQLDDLRLDRDVERRRRLVRNDQLRLGGRARGRSPRAGACRRRTGAGSGRCAGQARGCRCPRAADGAPSRLCRTHRQVGLDGLHELSPTVYSGFSEVSGSWKIAPILRPRMCRILSAEGCRCARPPAGSVPTAMRPAVRAGR